MTEGKSRTGFSGAVRVMLAVLIGMLAGGVFNASLGEQGADTPAFALIGGVLGFAAVIVARVRRRGREARED